MFYSGNDLTEHTPDSLTSEDIYYGDPEGPVVWKPGTFTKNLAFYPVYEWQGYVSHLPLYLILKKGSFRPRGRAARAAAHPNFRYNPFVVDADIRRLPDRTDYSPEITSRAGFVEEVADAMVADVREIEHRVDHDENLVLCGGKDSLNLLLLPWEKEVVAYSAQPNLPLVRKFVERNGLGMEVRELEDAVDVRLTEEVLLNACANELQHCRWTGHLRQIVADREGRPVLWKGQHGNGLLSEQWRGFRLHRYVHHAHGGAWLKNKVRSIARRLHGLYRELQRRLDPQGYFFELLWVRGAHWQGPHMAMLREATGAPALSGYHGRRVNEVIRRTDYETVVTRDLRPDIGAELHGDEVWYPDRNPGPEPSRARADASTVERFSAALAEATDVEVL